MAFRSCSEEEVEKDLTAEEDEGDEVTRRKESELLLQPSACSAASVVYICLSTEEITTEAAEGAEVEGAENSNHPLSALSDLSGLSGLHSPLLFVS